MTRLVQRISADAYPPAGDVVADRARVCARDGQATAVAAPEVPEAQTRPVSEAAS